MVKSRPVFLNSPDSNGFGEHCIMSPANGGVHNISFSNSISGNVQDEFMMWEPGKWIDNYLGTRFGVFLTFSSTEESLKKIFAINDLIERFNDPDGAQ